MRDLIHKRQYQLPQVVIGITAIAWIALGLSISIVKADDANRKPQEILADAGLRKLHRHWLCRSEIRLLRGLKQLSALEEEYRSVNKKWQTLGAEQKRLRVQMDSWNEQIANVEKEISESQISSPRILQLETKQRRLQKRLTEASEKLRTRLEGLNPKSSLSGAAKRCCHLRSKLETLSVSIANANRQRSTWYRQVGSEEQQALKAIADKSGKPARLGPAKPYEEILPATLKRLREKLWQPKVPIYREMHRFHVSAIIHQNTTITFGIEDTPLSLIPLALYAKTGKPISTAAIRREVQVGQLTLTGRVVKISSLRLGKTVLREVEFLVVDKGQNAIGPLLATSVLDDSGADINSQFLSLSFDK